MFRKKFKTNVQNQTNKAKAGTIKNSTIEVNSSPSNGDLWSALMKIHEHLDRVENKVSKTKKGLSLYVKYNGINENAKKIIMEMLKD